MLLQGRSDHSYGCRALCQPSAKYSRVAGNGEFTVIDNTHRSAGLRNQEIVKFKLDFITLFLGEAAAGKHVRWETRGEYNSQRC